MKLISWLLQLAFFTLLTLSQAFATSAREEELLRSASAMDSSIGIKTRSIDGLTQSKDPKVIEFLKTKAQDRFVDSKIRMAAIRALRSSTDESVIRVLKGIISGFASEDEKEAAFSSLHGIEEFRRN
ncbi:MAG: HEAT repeat domain-containing protein [Pseudobdellovibrionaceae bacterium]